MRGRPKYFILGVRKLGLYGGRREEKERKEEEKRRREKEEEIQVWKLILVSLEFMFGSMEFMFGTLLLFGTLGFVG